jgi:mannosyl-oligosaccharide alpha-1,2-mannosidase
LLIDPYPLLAEPFPGLLGSFLSIDNSFFLDRKGSWGIWTDSFYEYLLKAYIYAPETYSKHLTRWKLAADLAIRYLAGHPYGPS